MLRNLLENAGRYSPTGTTITVTLTEVEGGTQLSVIDQGPVLTKRIDSRSRSRSVASISVTAAAALA